MTKLELCRLPVEHIAAEDAVLFMWVTYPKLNWFLDIVKAWGFEYKTVAFVWVKKNKKSNSFFWGMGNYTRSNSEICIVATKGKPLKRLTASIHQIVYEPIAEHSEKPSIVRDKIVELFGDLPRVELFSRNKSEGWDVWGNEVESNESITKALTGQAC
jgi:N6-adenosine-specific RNA methylase IME4